jgi:PAS domain S-box-containing protein
MNKVAEELTGWTLSETLGKPLRDVFHIINEETLEEVESPVAKVLEKGIIVGLANHTILLRKDVSEVPLDDSGAPIKDDKGNVTGVVLVFHDISARKEMEQKIADYNTRLENLVEERTKKLELSSLYARNLIETSLDPLVTISREGKITDVNKATEDVTGCSREELVGSDFSNYFTDPEKARIGYQQVFTEGFVKDYPLSIRHKSGKITDVLYNASIYKNPQGDIEGVFAAARDITERKHAEQKLKDAERLANIGATAGMVGHDIRNPLQAITGDLYLAKTELESIPESNEKRSIQESLTEIEKNIDYINKIVQDLQDYARPLNPNPGEADLKLIIEKMLEKNGLPENVKASIKVEDEARKVVADADYLNRILYNLVTNAVQAMPKGGKLAICVYKDENDVILSVKDTGVGIPEAAKSKLFTPMFTTKSKGQGFGLPVVKRMTESLGGKVSFESQEGKGTTFIVRLPPKELNGKLALK